MKLGVYLHLGPLYGGDWNATIIRAADLRKSGVRHVFAANAAVDTVAMATGESAWLDGWKSQVQARLTELNSIGLTVGVRPMPLCAEQGSVEDDTVRPSRMIPSSNFTIRRTSIGAAKTLTLGDHYVYACHEAHDILDGKQRRWLVEQLGPRTIIYYGHRGLWNKYGADYGEHDLPHVVHVALNAAGKDDKSAEGKGQFVPRDCTAVQIDTYLIALAETDEDHSPLDTRFHCHLNVTAETSVSRLVNIVNCLRYRRDMLGIPLDIMVFRNVTDDGQTIHEVPANVLEAIKELECVV